MLLPNIVGLFSGDNLGKNIDSQWLLLQSKHLKLVVSSPDLARETNEWVVFVCCINPYERQKSE